MLNRKETHNKKKRHILSKTFIALFTSVLIMGSTLTLSFANEDLNAMLTNWFDEKRTDAIVEIKDAVSSEKDAQKSRLQEAVRTEIAAADAELKQLVKSEKERRVQNLRNYTDQLIKGIDIDNSDEKQKLVSQLDSIYAEAVQALNTANANWKSSVPPVKPETPEQPAKPEQPATPEAPAEPEAAEPQEPVTAPETPVEQPEDETAPPADEPETVESDEQ